MKALQLMEDEKRKTKEIGGYLGWISAYRSFITELCEINKLICKVEKVVKHTGLSFETLHRCEEILQGFAHGLGIYIRGEILAQMQETLKLLPEKKRIVFTSDIIESAFGKYKNYVSSNPMAGITNLVLTIAAFTASLEKKEIKKALETTTVNDIKKMDS